MCIYRGNDWFHHCNLICILYDSLIQGHALGGLYWIPPIAFNCVAWPTFLYWQYYSTPKQGLQFELEYEKMQKDGKADEKYIGELRERIDCMSKTCILLEGIAIYFVTLALAWYLFMWGSNCGTGCASRWYHNQFEQ